MEIKKINNIKNIIYKYLDFELINYDDELFYKKILFRVNALNLKTFDEYYNFFINNYQKNNLKELEECISVLTINESFFYRQKEHFEYLKNYIFKNLDKKINILSVGCAAGEEPLSILFTYLELNKNIKNINIDAIDIDKNIIGQAEELEYDLLSNKIKHLPTNFLNLFFDKHKDKYILKEDFKNIVNYKIANIKTLNINNKYDIIFCRNMLIYFNKADKESIIKNLYKILSYEGYIFFSSTDISEYIKTIFVEKIKFKNSFIFRKIKKIEPPKNNLLIEKKVSDKKVFILDDVIDKNDNLSNFKKFYDTLNFIIEDNKYDKYILDFINNKYISFDACKKLYKTIKFLTNKEIKIMNVNQNIKKQLLRIDFDFFQKII